MTDTFWVDDKDETTLPLLRVQQQPPQAGYAHALDLVRMSGKHLLALCHGEIARRSDTGHECDVLEFDWMQPFAVVDLYELLHIGAATIAADLLSTVAHYKAFKTEWQHTCFQSIGMKFRYGKGFAEQQEMTRAYSQLQRVIIDAESTTPKTDSRIREVIQQVYWACSPDTAHVAAMLHAQGDLVIAHFETAARNLAREYNTGIALSP